MGSRIPVSVRHLCHTLATFLALLAMSGVANAQYAPPYPSPPPTPPPSPSPTPTPTPVPSTYTMTPVVSNGAVMGSVADPMLINPWGLAVAPGGPIWVANNATQTSTAYDGAGNRQLVVNLPAGSRGPSGATGLVFNATTDFAFGNGAT